MKIVRINKKGIGYMSGIRSGDEIVSINGSPVRDEIDLRFLETDENLDILGSRDGNRRRIKIKKEIDKPLGLTLEPARFKTCNNRCIFCFVDQLPPGLRKSLYFKDDDYRLSFLYGNYISLTNMENDDYERIFTQRLSPLYISIHSTIPEIRRYLFQNQNAGNILDQIEFLSRGKINMHTQIVVCPGINDGSSLKKTILSIAKFYPFIASIAVVPVGLTKYRKNSLIPFNRNSSLKLIEEMSRLSERLARDYGRNFLYLSDEFFLLAGLSVPDSSYYNDFPQIENGVGMVRRFIDKGYKFPETATIVTGTLFGPVLQGMVNEDVCIVKNNFFGDEVTVSGLLTGRDILKALRNKPHHKRVILPNNCLSQSGLFLDDLSIEDMVRELGNSVEIGVSGVRC